MKAAKSNTGPRAAHLYNDKRIMNEVIMEAPLRDEGDDHYSDGLQAVAEEDNPLITEEQIKIIEAAVPKYTMKTLLGLSDRMFLTLKNTEYWMKTRGAPQRSTEKNFEFAKELFKIWDADKGGYLDLDEISLPLISLGLSTDAGFVEKLIRSLKQNKGGPKQVPNPKTKDRKAAKEAGMIVEDLTFTLKDFVSIFKADKIGEKISQIVLDECRVRQEKKFSEG